MEKVAGTDRYHGTEYSSSEGKAYLACGRPGRLEENE